MLVRINIGVVEQCYDLRSGSTKSVGIRDHKMFIVCERESKLRNFFTRLYTKL